MNSPKLPKGNPRLPDSINNAHESPLKDLLILASGVLAAVVLATLLLVWTAQWLAPWVPYQWERDLFASNGADRLFGSDDTQQSEDSKHKQQALQNLTNSLIAHQPDALPVTLHYLEEMEIPNAFATLGGHIFVSQGLLQSVSSENGLAMVLAHEYSHVQQRHPLKLALEQLSVSTMMGLLTGDGSGLGQLSASVTLLSFSRGMEREADAEALQMLQQHYGHTLGAEEFFEKMLDQHSESRWKTVFQTHPMTSERLAVITSSREMNSRPELTPMPEALITEGTERASPPPTKP